MCVTFGTVSFWFRGVFEGFEAVCCVFEFLFQVLLVCVDFSHAVVYVFVGVGGGEAAVFARAFIGSGGRGCRLRLFV